MHNKPGKAADRVILKLGGSVITDKSADCAINRAGLESLATAIAGARHDGIVIVHGAGSCGHPEAKRYHLDKGASMSRIGRLAGSTMPWLRPSGPKVWLQSASTRSTSPQQITAGL
jgi:isopentenyl phosphate kinase